MRRVAALLAIAAGAGAPARLAAQSHPVTIDRIVAVIGSKPILWSQLQEQMVAAQAQGQALPTDSTALTALRHQVLQSMVEEELIVQEAQRDTNVKVTDQEVQDQVEQTVQNVRRSYPNRDDFVRQLHLAGFDSEEEWRRYLADGQRRQILQQRLIELLRQKGKLKPIAPNESQMKQFWDQRKGEQGRRPATVSFRQVVILAQADSAARAQARQLADSLVDVLRRGTDFATLARRFSNDSATREQGGELGWFRLGQMVKPFEAAAFRLRPGAISDPVETVFGFHIIQVERVQPGQVLARHILITPRISDAQRAKGRRLADSVRTAWIGGSPYDSLTRFGDEDEQKLAEGVPPTDLPAEYQRLFAADSTLGVKPILIVGENTPKPKYVVLEVTARHGEGQLSYDDVKDQIRTRLSQDLMVQHFVDQLRHLTYVDIRF